jgi:hypothetical protein
LAIMEQVDAHQAVLAAHVWRVGPQRSTRGACAIPICSLESLHDRDGSSCSGEFEKK